VLAADSYFTSNEALLHERHPKLLAWLVGAGTRAVFDETHLGVAENPGMAALARKYRLHGVAAVLLLLAVLHVWGSAASLLPPPPGPGGAGPPPRGGRRPRWCRGGWGPRGGQARGAAAGASRGRGSRGGR